VFESKESIMKKFILASVLLAAGAAFAHGGHGGGGFRGGGSWGGSRGGGWGGSFHASRPVGGGWSRGPSFVAPRPVYVAPRPVYVAPRYYAPTVRSYGYGYGGYGYGGYGYGGTRAYVAPPVVIAPSVGFYAQLPYGAVSLYVGTQAYYYAGGSFFVPSGGGYSIVEAPLGAAVSELPPGAQQQVINGYTYATLNNTWFVWDGSRAAWVVVSCPF
jgi:hypothetical protein